jgi:hypothetical protein
METVIKLENLSRGMLMIFERFPQVDRTIPHLNVSGPRVNLQDVYSNKMKRKVAELYESDVKAFDYDFDEDYVEKEP